ncbi:expressed unknown protein [Seminavis robusta]|uniref:Uncharacterized protein n=1 Tax=Seminavis robusta TaxID=568900 RepID=A0A9N8D571_9STRA|nr:expressed unknown protein [Seminavis robusta]|eukprot:Sro8_g006501.1  (508) ;mRNA; r:22865-24388
MDPSALFATLDNPVPTSTWAVSKKRALEIALMAKADLETVQRFYELYPAALNKRLFRNVLKSGAKPGVVGFLATKCPGLVDKKAFEMAVVQGPGPDRPTDEDIITFAQINPDLLVLEGPTFYFFSIPLRLVLSWKYSQELTQTLFKMLAGKTRLSLWLPQNMILDLSSVFPWVVIDENSTTKRTALDMEAVMGMAPVLDSKSIKGFDSSCTAWELDAFSEFVRRLLSNQSMRELFLKFPEVPPEEQEQGKSMLFNTDAFKEVLSQCKIDHVVLHLGQNNPLALGFLGNSLGSMPCLKNLSFHAATDIAFASATPTICHSLSRNSLLDRITIYAENGTTTTGLDPILNSLATNHTLRAFSYKQGNADNFTRYHEVLVNILHKHNTTLVFVRFYDGRSEENPSGNLCSKLHPSEDLVAFYIGLNRCGRKKAFDPATTKAEFVELLVKAPVSWNRVDPPLHYHPDGSRRIGDIYDDQAPVLAAADVKDADEFNILYGLLHANPAKWSLHV